MSKKVMFVDDDEAFLALVRRACEKIEAITEVMTACDGQDGQDFITDLVKNRQDLPSLLFVDINMPRMNGFEFLQVLSAMRELHPELNSMRPIIMLTSSGEDRDRKKAKALGADDYIVKPAGLIKMRTIISEILG
jgi:CheY-like chemotaxis protein